ncbi:hypothetical protein M885DRAFT_533320 [Pelagophyceae sp. CCMP2097]|nr:hypothetical protein M885DRAFT_533320 [Pelagophyceae sp. CCMP2097]
MARHAVVSPRPATSAYEDERAARIKRNEAFLAALGLGGPSLMTPTKKPRKARPLVAVEDRRRSSRLTGASSVVRLSYDDGADATTAPRPRKRARAAVPRPTDDELRCLGAFDFAAFEAFLTTAHAISAANRRMVLRQCTRLVAGAGVDYANNWADGIAFRKGEPVGLSSDISQIIEDARDFEDAHGRDRSNGWLLKHPLRKLLLFQAHALLQARDQAEN